MPLSRPVSTVITLLATIGGRPIRKDLLMSSDLYTRENVIAVTFTQDANAYEALSRLKELDSGGHVRVTGAARWSCAARTAGLSKRIRSERNPGTRPPEAGSSACWWGFSGARWASSSAARAVC